MTIMKDQAIEQGFNVVDTISTLSDAKEDLITKVKQLLPNIVNSDNQVDVKALNDLFDITNTTSNNQGYELTFAGKGIARAKADEDTTKELKFEESQSKNAFDTENVIIRGDNIDALKVLYKNYHNKIKMIYIDPPYNTKSENFVYNDNFKQTEIKLIKEFGLNEQTTNFLENTYGTRSHSGWLSFMYPRLKLAKELLTDDGVIFISIDDNEQANLKIMCDEIFGEDNFAQGLFLWKKNKSGDQNSKMIASQHDYILLYSKNYNLIKDFGEAYKEEDLKDYKEIDEKGPFYFKPLYHSTRGKDLSFIHNNKEIYIEKSIWSKDTVIKALNENEVIERLNNKGKKQYYFKQRITKTVKKPYSYMSSRLPMNEQATASLEKLLEMSKGSCNIFTPKPDDLVKSFVEMPTNNDKNSIILDFFAGSGTTAHAVMQKNAEDGGNRKFILVQLDEKIDEKKSKPAFDFCKENNFKPVISSITIERVNRAGDKIKSENPTANIDTGYKVFSLTEKPKYDFNEQMDLKLEHARNSHIDTLFNMLLATCKTLDTKIEVIKENCIYKAGNEIYITSKVSTEELVQYKDLKINIDSLADISLQDYLNLDISNKENITIIY